MAASAKVFATFELVEHVLLHLPLRDLLLAQRVNKACFDVISSSSEIHRALFWKASAPPLEAFDGSDDRYGDWEWREREGAEPILPMVNPFIAVVCLNRTEDPQRTIRGKRLALVQASASKDIYAFRCARALPDFPHIPNSLDKMLLTHPPVGTLRVQANGRRSAIQVTVYGPEDEEEYEEEAEELSSGDETMSDAGDAESVASDDSTLDGEAEDYSGHESKVFTVGEEAGTTHGELLQFASLRWEGACKKSLPDVPSGVAQLETVPRAFYDLPEAAEWAQLKCDVDDITGLEMLGLLGMNEWDRWAAMRRIMDP